jgi:hypothetical protein
LPLSARMTDRDVEDVIEAAMSILDENRATISLRPIDAIAV